MLQILQKGNVSSQYSRFRTPIWAMGSQVLTSGANFVASIIIIHGSNLGEFGKFSFFFFLIMITRKFLIGAFLLPMSSIMPTLDQGEMPAYRGFLFLYSFSFSALSSLIIIASIPVIRYTADLQWLDSYIVPFLAANIAANMSDFVRRVRLDAGEPIASFAVDACRFGFQLVLLIIIWQTSLMPLSGEVALWAIAMSSTLGGFVGLVEMSSIRWSSSLSKSFWKRHLHFARWMGLSTILEVVQNSVPLFIAMAVLGESALGTLRALQQLANLLNLPFNGLMQVMPSMAARRHASQGVNAMRSLLIKFTGTSIVFIIFISIAILIASPLIVNKLLGVTDAQSFSIFIAFMALNVIMLVRLPFLIAYNIVGKPHAVTLSNVFGAVLASVGTWILIPLWGPITVPLVTAAGLAIATIFFIFNPHAEAVKART